jgi:hypothetical protein
MILFFVLLGVLILAGFVLAITVIVSFFAYAYFTQDKVVVEQVRIDPTF